MAGRFQHFTWTPGAEPKVDSMSDLLAQLPQDEVLWLSAPMLKYCDLSEMYILGPCTSCTESSPFSSHVSKGPQGQSKLSKIGLPSSLSR